MHSTSPTTSLPLRHPCGAQPQHLLSLRLTQFSQTLSPHTTSNSRRTTSLRSLLLSQSQRAYVQSLAESKVQLLTFGVASLNGTTSTLSTIKAEAKTEVLSSSMVRTSQALSRMQTSPVFILLFSPMRLLPTQRITRWLLLLKKRHSQSATAPWFIQRRSSRISQISLKRMKL